MAVSSRDDDEMISGINVTPLVDIALVLLIVFLVTAKVLVSPALAMSLPTASHTADVDSPFSLELGADGKVLVGGVPAESDASIVTLARAAHARNAEVRAILRVDGAVPHARVIRAIDLIKEAGIDRIAFGVASGRASSPLVGAPR